jgi:Protein of unknown function (DUF1279)
MMKAVRPVLVRQWLWRIGSQQRQHHHHKQHGHSKISPPFFSFLHGVVLPHQRNVNDESSKYNVRSFSGVPTHDPTMRERATQHARNSAKVARKGAKSAGEMMKQYGPVFFGTYISIYWAFLALLYGGVDSGLIDPLTVIQFIKSNSDAATESAPTTVEYVVGFMEHYSLTAPYAPYVAKNPHFANLGVAWIGVKFTEPVRLALAMAVVPRVARYFGRDKKEEEDVSVDPNEATSETGAEKVGTKVAEDAPESSTTNDGTKKA